MNVVCVIPAYQPGARFIELVGALRAAFASVVVIDDGSGARFSSIFDAVRSSGAKVMRHDLNRGKGAALKTGIETALLATAGVAGVVSADADGQHSVEDILSVARTLLTHPSSLVLGVRSFDRAVPLANRVGNSVARWAVRSCVGLRLRDTQTGLRGIPAAFARQLLSLRSTRYDFEMEMLVAAKRGGLSIVEEPIQTIYVDGNRSSHFRPLVDSGRVLRALLR